MQGLAERVNDGFLSYEALAAKGNDEVVAVLMEIPGIGLCLPTIRGDNLIKYKCRLSPAEGDMKIPKCIVGLMIISIIALCAGSASAWDTRWQFKQDAPSNNYGSGSRDTEMQKKFDYNSI